MKLACVFPCMGATRGTRRKTKKRYRSVCRHSRNRQEGKAKDLPPQGRPIVLYNVYLLGRAERSRLRRARTRARSQLLPTPPPLFLPTTLVSPFLVPRTPRRYRLGLLVPHRPAPSPSLLTEPATATYNLGRLSAARQHVEAVGVVGAARLARAILTEPHAEGCGGAR